ncbi:MAG: VCBS repeat-containing protein [Verrucomicrobiae bacterium]|nr:VCBS repeat-containing protein [Verrucomicrobiae bacterium]
MKFYFSFIIFAVIYSFCFGDDWAARHPQCFKFEKSEYFGKIIEKARAPATVWIIKSCDINKDGMVEFLLGCADFKLYCRDKNNAEMWNYDLGGLPTCMEACDIDLDGEIEIICATLNGGGEIFVLNKNGVLLWKVALGHGALTLSIADLDGDGKNELICGGLDNALSVFSCEGKQLRRMDMGRAPRVYIKNIDVGDINGDGKFEIILVPSTPQSIVALSQCGETLWKKTLPDAIDSCAFINNSRGTEKILCVGRRPFILDGDGNILSQGGAEKVRETTQILKRDFTGDGIDDFLLNKYSGQLSLIDGADFKIAWKTNPKDVNHSYFISTCIADCDNDGKAEVVCASSGLRDENYYRFEIGREVKRRGMDDVEACNYTNTEVGRNLFAICEHVKNIPEKNVKDKDKIHILINGVNMPMILKDAKTEILKASKPANLYRKTNICFEFISKIQNMESGFYPQFMMSKDELTRAAEILEANNVRTYLYIMHGCRPQVTIDALEAMLKAAPNAIAGFDISEHNSYYKSPSWNVAKCYIEDVLKLCQKYKKKFLIEDFGKFFLTVATDADIYEKWFLPENRDVLVPISKNNTYYADINEGAILGLWFSGKVSEWGINAEEWMAKFGTVPDFCPADASLRRDLKGLSQGASYISMENSNFNFFDVRKGEIAIQGRLSHDIVYRLIEKGVIQRVEKDQLRNISPVAFQISHNQEMDEIIGDWPFLFLRNKKAGFIDAGYPIATTADGYISNYFYDSKTYYDNYFPKTKFGFLTYFSNFVKKNEIPLMIKDVIQSDGKWIFVDGKKIKNARQFVLDAVAHCAKDVPFSMNNAFLSVVQISDKEYILYLISPGMLQPLPIKGDLNIMLSRKVDLFDIINQKSLGVFDQKASIAIPKGAFSVLKATVM